MDSTERIVDEWLSRTETETTFSPGPVQDMLFDLYGALRDEPVVEVITRWLTLSIERNLFSAAEIRGLLLEIQGQLPASSTTA